MNDLDKLHKKLMQNAEYRAEFESTREEFEVMRAIISARCEQNITQAQLAEKSGLRQSNISRIENGTCSPNVNTLKQIAKGLGKNLHIEFR